MSSLSLPASLTFDPTSPISSPASSEVLDPVSSEIPDFISPIPDLSDENIYESYSENDTINNVIKNNNTKNSKKRTAPIHDYLNELDDGTRVCDVCSNIPDIKKPSKWAPGTSLSMISRHFESKHPSLYRDFK
ncbi:16708_t:CDS:1 [Dentiscutata erythropus]|uniref:16708_t:CDS:1 n=1 Tax=Dentiscutata erythropus TaxID=1348616 RepID=A0A9N9GGG4_9GLOM|nr:16708_t:CDS:1 [Dentiscutata erythropus]